MQCAMKTIITQHPSLLIVGAEEDTFNFTLKEIQKTGTCNGCSHCYRCGQIIKEKDLSLCIIRPNERYTLENLEPINRLSQLAREPKDPFFFIITKADLLNPSCANSLLKIVEEPPTGYHFVFLTNRPSLVLSTIRSRSITHYIPTSIKLKEAASITNYFTTFENSDPLAFSKELQQCTMTEYDCLSQVDYLLNHWIQTLKKLFKTYPHAINKIHATQAFISLCLNTLENPPQPGSAKIFWKNFFLQKQKVRLS